MKKETRIVKSGDGLNHTATLDVYDWSVLDWFLASDTAPDIEEVVDICLSELPDGASLSDALTAFLDGFKSRYRREWQQSEAILLAEFAPDPLKLRDPDAKHLYGQDSILERLRTKRLPEE